VLLKDFGFSQPLVEQIMDYLDTSSQRLEENQPQPVGKRAFGSSPSSVACASDADKAKDHVRTAITDMVAGLQQYRAGFHEMSRRAEDVEVVTTTELQQQFNRAEACQAPTFASPSQCTVPGASGEDGQ